MFMMLSLDANDVHLKQYRLNAFTVLCFVFIDRCKRSVLYFDVPCLGVLGTRPCRVNMSKFLEVSCCVAHAC